MKTKIFSGDYSRLRKKERLEKIELDRVVKLTLENLDVSSLLDIGTGTGVFAEAFSAYVPKITGLDLNEEALAKAKEFAPMAEFRQGKMEALPFEDDSFDVVFFGFVLHETPERLKALQEGLRCAKKRVFVFELPEMEKDGNTATGRRVNPDEIAGYAKELGIEKFRQINFSEMIAYVFDLGA